MSVATVCYAHIEVCSGYVEVLCVAPVTGLPRFRHGLAPRGQEEAMRTMMTMRCPFGVLRLYAEGDELVAIDLPDHPGPEAPQR